jgi:ankyrin repeat protein
MFQWPDDGHDNDSDSDELGEQSMSIILPTLCAWCVLQGRGAMTEDTLRCDEAIKTVKNNKCCIGKLIADHKDWNLELLQQEITFLVAHGANPQYKNDKGRSPLHECALHDSIVGMKALMTMDMKNLSSKNMLDTMLQDASVAHNYDHVCEDEQQDKIEELEENIDLLETTNLGLTIIHLASMKGHSKLLNEIVKHMSKSLNILEKDNHHENHENETILTTPAHHVLPADLFDLPDQLGFTPAMYAAEKGHVNCLKILFYALWCDDKKHRIRSSFELIHPRPHQRSLTHYASMNGRVNVLKCLHSIHCCYHLHQDVECYYPIDLAKKFNRLGCVAYLMSSCPHPFVNNNACCGICDTFLKFKNGPEYCPLPGHRNLTLADAVLDNFYQMHVDSQKKMGGGIIDRRIDDYNLWYKLSNIGTNYSNDVRTDSIEVEDFSNATCSVLKFIGIEKNKLNVTLMDAVESCSNYLGKNDHLDSLNSSQFHAFLATLPVIQNLSPSHQQYVYRRHKRRGGGEIEPTVL